MQQNICRMVNRNILPAIKVWIYLHSKCLSGGNSTENARTIAMAFIYDKQKLRHSFRFGVALSHTRWRRHRCACRDTRNTSAKVNILNLHSPIHSQSQRLWKDFLCENAIHANGQTVVITLSNLNSNLYCIFLWFQ